MKKTALIMIFIFGVYFLYSQNLNNWIWAKNYGDTYADVAKSITSDGNNIYSTGSYIYAINFGNGYSYSSFGSNQNMFVLKTDNNGNTIWAKNIHSNSGNTSGEAITLDNNKNIIVGGVTNANSVTENTTTISNPLPGKTMIFILKYDTNNNVLFSKKFYSNNNCTLTNINTDNNNNIFVAGYFTGKYMIAESDTLINTDTSGTKADAFLIKLNPNGNLLWKKTVSVSTTTLTNDYSKGIAINNNAIYWLVFATDNSNAQLIKVNNNTSNIIWKKNITNFNPPISNNCIAYQKNANRITLIGNLSSSITLIDNYAIDKPFIALLDTNASLTNMDTPISPPYGYNYFQSINTDKHDNIILTGAYSGSITVKNQTINGGGIWVSMLNDNSNFAYWLAGTSGGSSHFGYQVCTDNSNNVYVTGRLGTGNNVSFGSINITKSNASDAFIAKVDGMTSSPFMLSTQKNFNIFPNPNNGTFFIESTYSTGVKIFNILGQSIEEKDILPHQQYSFHLPQGMYFIYDQEGKTVYKVSVIE